MQRQRQQLLILRPRRRVRRHDPTLLEQGEEVLKTEVSFPVVLTVIVLTAVSIFAFGLWMINRPLKPMRADREARAKVRSIPQPVDSTLRVKRGFEVDRAKIDLLHE